MASRMVSVPGLSVWKVMPSHECFLLLDGRRCQEESSRLRPGTFMPMMPICRSTASGSSSSLKAVVVRIGRIHGHQNVSKGWRLMHSMSASGR